jgi:hypothetical protein
LSVRNESNAVDDYNTYQAPFWRRVLSTAEIGESPSGIAKHGELVVLVKEGEQRHQCVLAKDNIAAARAVSCDVSKSPNSLQNEEQVQCK